MLVVHPSSTCDVCLEGYTWTAPERTPHAIACGHIFCHQCLRSTQPSHCPLCRKQFRSDKIKKLHVDRTPGPEEELLEQEMSLLQRAALAFGDEVQDEEMVLAANEAQRWLGLREENSAGSPRSLRNNVLEVVASALHRYRVMRKQTNRDVDTLKKELQVSEQEIRTKIVDLQRAQAVESALLKQTRQLEEHLKEIPHLQSENTRLTNEIGELRAKFINSSNPLPAPPQPVNPERLASLTRPITSMSRNSAAALAASVPPSVGAGQSTIRASARPASLFPTEVNPNIPEMEAQRRKGVVPGAPSTQKIVPPRPDPVDPTHVWKPGSEVPPIHPVFMPTYEWPPPTDAGFGQPEFASTSQPRSQGNHPVRAAEVCYKPDVGWVAGSLTPRPWQDGVVLADAAEIPPENDDESPLDEEDKESPLEEDEDNYLAPRVNGFTSHRQHAPTRDEAARALGFSAPSSSRGRTEQIQDMHPRPPFRERSSTPSVAPSLTRGISDSSASSASTSLSSLALLAPPASTLTRNPSDVIVPSRLREVVDDAQSPEPSPASTWGTVTTATARSSRRPSRRASRQSSFGDLNLRGLPTPLADSRPSSTTSSLADLGLSIQLASSSTTSIVTSTSTTSSLSGIGLTGLPGSRSSRAQPSSALRTGPPVTTRPMVGGMHRRVSFDLPIREETPEAVNEPTRVAATPRVVPISVSRPVPTEPPASADSRDSLGLMLNTSAGGSSGSGGRTRQAIGGESDLEALDSSLMRLAITDTSEDRHAHRRRRQPRHVSMSDVEDSVHVGSRTGYRFYTSETESDVSEPRSTRFRPMSVVSEMINAPVQPPAFSRRTSSESGGSSRSRPISDTGPAPELEARDRRTSSHATNTYVSSSTFSPRSTQRPAASQRSSDPNAANHRNSSTEGASPVANRHNRRATESAISLEAVLSSSSDTYSTSLSSSLLLSFSPAGPSTTSSATTADGAPSSIHAPRPVNRGQTNNVFGLWNSRTAR